MNKRPVHPGDILAQVIKPRGPYSANELARLAGVSQPTMWRILNKEVADPKNAALQKIARVLRVSVAQLRGEAPMHTVGEELGRYNVAAGPPVSIVPMISWVQAGQLNDVEDPFQPGEGERPIYTTRRVGPRAYALRVRGDSMENPGGKPTFPEGCIIIVDPDKEAHAGSFVVVRFDNRQEATFKQLTEDAGQRFLKPLNPRYPIIAIDGDATLCGTWVQTIIDSD